MPLTRRHMPDFRASVRAIMVYGGRFGPQPTHRRSASSSMLLGRSLFSSHEWVEVTRIYQADEAHNYYGCWFSAAVGSGIWLNTRNLVRPPQYPDSSMPLTLAWLERHNLTLESAMARFGLSAGRVDKALSQARDRPLPHFHQRMHP